MPTFNLVERPWIPVQTVGGEAAELSISDVLNRAHELRAIEDESPLVVVALHRLLLAVIHRAIDGPKDIEAWGELWESGSFHVTPIADYLQRWRDRFELFDAAHPFFQTSGFSVKESTPVTKLSVELASGNNKMLFDHTRDADLTPFTPARAARALVTAQAFALGGGKGVTSSLFGEHPYLSHGPLVQGVASLLRGPTLFGTLLLNLLVYRSDKPMPRTGDDLPVWEHNDPFKPGERIPNGYLDYLTWMSRHILLEPVGPDGGELVCRMHIGQACSLPQNKVRDPAFAFKRLKDQSTRPVGLSPERSLWRDSEALFAITSTEDLGRPAVFRQAQTAAEAGYLDEEVPLTCAFVGIANDKANPLLWRVETVPASVRLLRDEEASARLCKGVSFAEDAGDRLDRAVRSLASNILPPGADRSALSRFTTSLGTLSRYWAGLDSRFPSFAANVAAAGRDALVSWKSDVRSNAHESFRSTVDNCLGRTPREMKARAKTEALLTGLLKGLE